MHASLALSILTNSPVGGGRFPEGKGGEQSSETVDSAGCLALEERRRNNRGSIRRMHSTLRKTCGQIWSEEAGQLAY